MALHAAVAVPVPLRRVFTYAVLEAQRERIAPGVRVRVPFGGRRVVGTVVQWPAPAPDASIEIKPIEAVLADGRRLSPEMLELTRFVADYYLSSWGDAIEAALPPEPGPLAARRGVRPLQGADPAALDPRARAQRRLLERLLAATEPVALADLDPSVRRHARALVAAGLAAFVELDADREDEGSAGPAAPARRPTAAQAAVLETLGDAITEGAYRPFLLYGATGSGKTEVYLQAAQRTLDLGRGVLWLVPEIGLTPLLLQTIYDRFPGRAVVLHSGLGRRERFAGWDRVRRGERPIVVGTRSAVFAPLPDPGLIVVDEEHDGSYKQSETPRYNGRDVAVLRASRARATIVLGSATPSMESYAHARAGRYALLRLGGRIEERPLPEVRVVDMREVFVACGEVAPLSPLLIDELRACLERGEQALVLRNRRGWATALHCPTCGERVQCGRCSIALTWHRAARRLRCHYCGFETRRPANCPHCTAETLNELGEGTERVEDALRAALPGTRIERMDRDTIRRRGAHEALLRRFERGAVDVLVGTQMIAKGHDFPRVTLVGVLSADHALGLPDFRAAERAFQLLTQVAGRAGRGTRPGKVVIQAFDASHPVLKLAAAQDFEAFYAREIRYRRALRYPPLVALVQIIVHDRDELQARLWAERVAAALRAEEGGRLLLSGPGPAPVERVKGRFRQQILARSAGRRRLVEAIDRALAAIEGQVPRRALVVDVDPLSLL